MATTTKTAPAAVKTFVEGGKRGPKRKPFNYSRHHIAFRDPEDFAWFLSTYPDWTGVLAYWYRLKPKIDLMRLPGVTETNLQTTSLAEEMTGEYAARAPWGGRGKYMLKFTDANRSTEAQEVARVWFVVDDPDLPPKYDPRTLLIHEPENSDEVARLLAAGVLVRDGEYGTPRVRTDGGPSAGVAVAVPPAAPVAVPSAFSASIGDQLVIKLLDRALPSATPVPTAGDVLEQSFRIADRFREVTGAASVPVPSLDQIADAVVLRMKAAGPPAGGMMQELETYERVSGLLDKIGAGRALDGAAAGAPLWAQMFGGLLESTVKPLLPAVVSFLMRGSGPVAVPVPGLAAAGAPPAAGAPAAAPPLVLLSADAPLMDRVEQVARLALIKSAEGVSGFRFASWLCGYYPGGVEVFQLFESAGGTDGCLGFLAMNPAFAPELAARGAELQSWLDDFFTFDSTAPEVLTDEVLTTA